jgi:hypothetical protein
MGRSFWNIYEIPTICSIDMSKKCNTCWGYGLWAIGDGVPMGPIDFEDGEANKKCPECGSGRE